MPFTRFDRYVDRHARSFTERLQSFCRMPSVAARGVGMRSVAESVEQMMQRIGAGTRLFKLGSSFPIVYGEFGAGERCFTVYSHYDVQPVGQLTEWSSGPFAADVRDGKLYARGASNSKGDLIARLAAIEAYQKSFGKLPVCLRFIVEGEAGLASPGLQRFSAEHPDLVRANGCIWDEGNKDTQENFTINLGFKGIAFIELRAYGARSDLHSKWGGIVPNPAWRLVQALATVASPKGVITIDGFTSHVAPVTTEDTHALKTVELDEAGLRNEFRIGGWVRGLTGRALAKELIFAPTCTICGIRTGHTEAGAKTVLPGTATARLDFRLVPDLSPELVVKLLREHLDRRGFHDIEIIELGSAPFTKSSTQTLVARAAIESTPEVYGASPIIYPLNPASGPVGAFCAVNFPPTPIVSFGISYAASNPHGPDEHIRLDDFLQGVKYFGRVIDRLAKLSADKSLAPEQEPYVQLAGPGAKS